MRIGDVEIVPLVEEDPWQEKGAAEFFGGGSQHVVDANRDWLEPAGQLAASGLPVLVLQAFLVRTPESLVLVDTNLGDGKTLEDPSAPPRTTWATTLERYGVDRAAVDYVLTTHLHADHVGGSTELVDGRWTPVFPNATHLIHGDDVEYWRHPAEGSQRSWKMMEHSFRESVAPLEDAGLLATWTGERRVDPWVTLREAPGHTPGLSMVHVDVDGTRFVFVGDLVHHAIQLVELDWVPIVDEDPTRAAAARRAVLGWAADEGAIVVPGHFPSPRAFRPRRDGDRFAIAEWVPLE
jgi:glyoxylase-like metal-dependent hydrolase (beta-lactamase superfamily II)